MWVTVRGTAVAVFAVQPSVMRDAARRLHGSKREAS